MKAQTKVQVRTTAGLVDAPCYHQWKQNIAGMDFEFALHVAAGYAKGFVTPLAISELGTGYDIKATLTHPVSRAPLSTANIQGLKAAQVKGVAHAALHNLLHKKVGAGLFMRSLLGAQMQIAKVDLSQYEVKGDVPALVQHTITGEGKVTFENSALLAGLREPAIANVTMDYTPSAEEAAAAIADAEQINRNLAKYGTIDSPPTTASDWGSPTEEEWYEGLEPENKLEYLTSKLEQLVKDSRELTKRATKADYDRIDDMDSDIRDIEAKIKALTLDGLKLRLDALNDQAAQHGTMTGDLTDDQYEDLSYNICSLEKEIADLEGKPCSS